jgi:hypothetical protein
MAWSEFLNGGFPLNAVTTPPTSRLPGSPGDSDEPLFQTAAGKSGLLCGKALWQQDAYRMIQRRAGRRPASRTQIGNHTFRATGITAYLRNSGKLEIA